MSSAIPAFLAAALLLASCADPERAAARAVRRAGPAQLRADAARLSKNVFAAHGPRLHVLRPTETPASFQQLMPQSVNAYPDGFALTLRVRGRLRSGIYIMPAGLDRAPSVANGEQFTPLADGIYWFTFGH